MRKTRKKQKKLENVYSNYTLNKIKTFILKRIDVIEINYDELKLHHANIFKDICDYKTIKYNQDLIKYILKDTENFYEIQNKIINKNFIENVSIDWTPSGPCDVDMYLLKLSIELKSQDIEIISSQGNYTFLKSIKDKLDTNQKSSLKFNDIISLIFLIIFIILYIYLTVKLFIS